MSALISPSAFPVPHSKRGRPRIQDEFTDRTDLSAVQKYQLRHGQQLGTRLARTARVDLGLALVSLVAKPGVPLTLDDIAAWCDCSRQAIESIERRALLKLRTHLFFQDRSTCAELRQALTHARKPARPATRRLSLAA